MGPLRVASFNIQHGRLSTGEVDTAVTARACASLAVDVLALQEVDRRRSRSRFADQAAEVADACGMACVFRRTHRKWWWLWGEYGNALLVRGAISDVEVIALPRAARAEPRNALLTTAHVDGLLISIAATHLSVRGVENEPQLLVVLDALAGRPRPWLLLGDLNRGPGQVAPLVERAGLTLADTSAHSFPAHSPRARIDHVAVAGLEVGAVELRELPVSDHRALVAEVQSRA